jgi:archaellum component FlaF (FlaF/FlaG flagellin family)
VGLSSAIAGGIMMTMISIVLLMAIPTIVSTNVSMNRAYSERAQLETEYLRTSISMSSLQASPADDIVTITIANDGSSKLWNYQKFSLFITYDAQVAPLQEERRTEVLVYQGITQDVDAGRWGIDAFVSDGVDPQIVNPDESFTIVCRLGYNTTAIGDLSAVISTDNGMTTTKSVVIS